MKTFSVNIHEAEEKVLLEAALPGIDKDSIDITIEDNVLTVTAQRSANVAEGYAIYHSEFASNKTKANNDENANQVSRSFQLGKDIDRENISADYTDGLLTITLLKAKEVTKKITVK